MSCNKTDIIIFGGQSNMQGQSECLLNGYAAEGCMEYLYITDSLVPLKNPCGEYIKIDGSVGEEFKGDLIANEDEFIKWLNSIALGASFEGGTNMIPAFCKSYRKECGNNVVAVSAAKGSTRLIKWLEGSKEHEILIKKASAAIGKCNRINKIYFVWLQGESDALSSVSAKEYEEKLIEFKNQLKQKLGIDKFAIIRVGRFTNDDRDLEIIKAQEAVCCNDSDFVMLTRITTSINEKAEYMNPVFRGHYSAKGLEYIGEVAGATLARLEE